ncbi:MAG: dNTP triphosphohydrolase [Bacteroidetes bacterium]|nr:dNTP triphosphohydrolase [Bacteroidota bacterium]
MTQNGFYSDFDTNTPGGERKADYRTPFEMDRDRLIHTSAFRRLQAKTQVFFAGEYDFYRSRLTHSIEVAQIGRSITAFLNQTSPHLSAHFYLDAALVEAICLAHDLGHPPFGHAGERTLHTLMINQGGFEGNAQTLRLLTDTIYQDETGRKGLQPTRAFTDGVMKYKATFSEWPQPPENHFLYDSQLPVREWVFAGDTAKRSPADWNELKSIECQIMDWADDTAYSVNDIIDGAHAGFITHHRVEKWAGSRSLTPREHDWIQDLLRLIGSEDIHRQFSRKIGRFLQATRLDPVTHAHAPDSNRYRFMLHIDEEAQAESRLYKKLAVALVFRTPQLQQFEFKGDRVLRELFNAFSEQAVNGKYGILPVSLREGLDRAGSETDRSRLICDYLAGMTDRFAIRTYRRLFDPDYGSLSDLI